MMPENKKLLSFSFINNKHLHVDKALMSPGERSFISHCTMVALNDDNKRLIWFLNFTLTAQLVEERREVKGHVRKQELSSKQRFSDGICW